MIDENILMKALLVIAGIWVILFLLMAEKLSRRSHSIIIQSMSIAALMISGIELYYIAAYDLYGDWFACFFFCPGFFERIIGILILGIVLAIQIVGISLGLTYVGEDKVNQPAGFLCWVISVAIGVIINVFGSRISFDINSCGLLAIPIAAYTLFIVGKFWLNGYFLTGCITGAYYFINGFAVFVTGLYFFSVLVGIFVIIIMAALLLGALGGLGSRTSAGGTTILDEHGIRHDLRSHDDGGFKDEGGRYWHRSEGGFETDD
ncbi:MAG: hypothetical protein K2I43_00555 [Alistipes sp.]|nr:hypothetical protein [Alistipes sp.]